MSSASKPNVEPVEDRSEVSPAGRALSRAAAVTLIAVAVAGLVLLAVLLILS